MNTVTKRHQPLDTPCNLIHCGAGKGEPCIDIFGDGKPMKKPHYNRWYWAHMLNDYGIEVARLRR